MIKNNGRNYAPHHWLSEAATVHQLLKQCSGWGEDKQAQGKVRNSPPYLAVGMQFVIKVAFQGAGDGLCNKRYWDNW